MAAPLRVFSEGAPALSHEPQLFAKSPEHAIDDRRLNGTEHRVLTALAFLGRNSFPEVRATHTQVADKARTSERTVRRCMAKLRTLGYARQTGEGLIVLTYETRAPFQLESDDSKRGQKSTDRPKVAALVRTKVAAHARPNLAAPSLFERELNQREDPSSPPAAKVEPPATTGQSNPDPPKTTARAVPPTMAEVARLVAVGGNQSAASADARAELIDYRDRGLIDPALIPGQWPEERARMQPNENRLRDELGKVHPQPVRSHVPRCSVTVYPDGQTEAKTQEPLPMPEKCPP